MLLFLPRIGYKKAMLAGLLISMFACIGMYYGISFALIKVSVYAMVGLVTENFKVHNSFMSTVEGVFMIGTALAYFLFPAFNIGGEPDAWLRVYWVLVAMTLVSFLFFVKFDDDSEIPGTDFLDDFTQMWLLCGKLLVLVFLSAAFLFVMVEQGIMTW